MDLTQLDELTEQQLAIVIAAAQQKLVDLEIARQQERESIQESIATTSVEELVALIGPENPTTSGFDSISEIELFTDQEISGNVALAVRTLLNNDRKLAKILLDVARTQRA